MQINKWIFSKPTYMVNNKAICSEINVGTPDQTILEAHVKHITKILYEKKVHQILEQLVMKEHLWSKIYMRHPNKELHKSSLELYNALPQNIKALPPSKIKRKR